jgi:hypothetical protein
MTERSLGASVCRREKMVPLPLWAEGNFPVEPEQFFMKLSKRIELKDA